MRLNELAPAPGEKHKRKRVGRGDGSGHGSYSGKGQKGQKARAGGGVRPGFEGGQLPIIERLPSKRGFTNIFRVEYSVVNVGQLNRFTAGTEVSLEQLADVGLVKKRGRPVKVLAGGELEHALTVRVDAFSTAAKQKIEAAGGKAEELGAR